MPEYQKDGIPPVLSALFQFAEEPGFFFIDKGQDDDGNEYFREDVDRCR
jgi:hypothetical protein